MRWVIFGDAHYQDGSGSDDFRNENLLIEFIRSQAAIGGTRIFGNGDLEDVWQMLLQKIWWHRSRLVKVIRDFVERIAGNHDYMPFARFAPTIYQGQSGAEKGVVILHGYHFDIFNRKPRTALGRIVAGLFGWLERWIHRDIDDWCLELIKMKAKVPPSSRNIRRNSRAILRNIAEAPGSY